jgi:hypothetical protein
MLVLVDWFLSLWIMICMSQQQSLLLESDQQQLFWNLRTETTGCLWKQVTRSCWTRPECCICPSQGHINLTLHLTKPSHGLRTLRLSKSKSDKHLFSFVRFEVRRWKFGFWSSWLWHRIYYLVSGYQRSGGTYGLHFQGWIIIIIIIIITAYLYNYNNFDSTVMIKITINIIIFFVFVILFCVLRFLVLSLISGK